MCLLPRIWLLWRTLKSPMGNWAVFKSCSRSFTSVINSDISDHWCCSLGIPHGISPRGRGWAMVKYTDIRERNIGKPVSSQHIGTTSINYAFEDKYRKNYNIRLPKSQNLNEYRLVLSLAVLNPLKTGLKERMKMKMEQHRQAMLQLHLGDQQFNLLLRCGLY